MLWYIYFFLFHSLSCPKWFCIFKGYEFLNFSWEVLSWKSLQYRIAFISLIIRRQPHCLLKVDISSLGYTQEHPEGTLKKPSRSTVWQFGIRRQVTWDNSLGITSTYGSRWKGHVGSETSSSNLSEWRRVQGRWVVVIDEKEKGERGGIVFRSGSWCTGVQNFRTFLHVTCSEAHLQIKGQLEWSGVIAYGDRDTNEW